MPGRPTTIALAATSALFGGQGNSIENFSSYSTIVGGQYNLVQAGAEHSIETFGKAHQKVQLRTTDLVFVTQAIMGE